MTPSSSQKSHKPVSSNKRYKTEKEGKNGKVISKEMRFPSVFLGFRRAVIAVIATNRFAKLCKVKEESISAEVIAGES